MTRILLSIIRVHVTILSIPGAGSIIAAGWLATTCNGGGIGIKCPVPKIASEFCAST